MLPPVSQFNTQVSALGISNNDHIVVYDTWGVGPACRVYWTFKVFGHQNIHILNGGLPKWKKEGLPTVSGPSTSNFTRSSYSATFHPELVVSYDQLSGLIKDDAVIVFDARPASRFTGKDPEPRAGISSGHMPNSCSLPAGFLSNPDGTFKSREDILSLVQTHIDNLNKEDYLNDKTDDVQQRVITSCGSGIMACALHVALKEVGVDSAVYDGSWTEYAQMKDSVILKSTSSDPV
jgi:thiosulfate/3-mercaptopyruvate sulfurtransferase